MLTIAITHKIHEDNNDPFSADEIEKLREHSWIAIGTNWRNRLERDWANNAKACENFRLFNLLAMQGGCVVANYQGLPPHLRVIGLLESATTGQPELWNGLRMLRLTRAKRINVRDVGIEDLQLLPGRTIVDVSNRAGDRVAKLLG